MKHYECPVGDWSCPYYASGDCLMVEDGDDPLAECDEAYYYDPEGNNYYYSRNGS